jgi:hypothetical protein
VNAVEPTLRKNADKLRTALATTTERLGVKGMSIKRNLTDAQSATLKSGHGVVQGYISASPRLMTRTR